MFTEEFRSTLRSRLVERAEHDARLVGVALTGSASVGREDRWSDIDIALGVGADSDLAEVVDDWTNHLRSEFGVVDTVDVVSRSTLYRVFLLPDTLQVDIAFAPAHEFGALAPTFRLLSGVAVDQPSPQPTPVEHLIGMAWVYAIHVRSSLGRQRVLQAQHMLGGLRDHVVMLACRRHGLPAAQGRGVDDLPEPLVEALADTFVGGTFAGDLLAAFGRTLQLLQAEVAFVDADRAEALVPVFAELARSAGEAR